MPKEDTRITLMVDSREKTPFVYRPSKDIKEIVVAKLDVGDYSVQGLESSICIERKGSASELLSNILTKDNKRFYAELERMRAVRFRWIVCEFDLSDMALAIKYIPRASRSYFSFDKVVGSFASIMTKYAIPILFCGKPRTYISRAKNKRTVNRAKDLTKKLLLKAAKYSGDS